MTQWYYEDSGRVHGPVAEADLKTMFADGLLHPTARVWHEGFGQEWRSASATSLVAEPITGNPPPLAAAPAQSALIAPPPPAPPAGAPQTDAAPQVAVPAVTAYQPRYATLLAVIPLIMMVLEIVALAGGVDPADPVIDRGVFLWTLILSLWFAHKDAKAVSAAGLNPQGRTMVPFVLLTQIGYFLRRRSVSGLPLKPLWIWLGAIVIYAIFNVIAYT